MRNLFFNALIYRWFFFPRQGPRLTRRRVVGRHPPPARNAGADRDREFRKTRSGFGCHRGTIRLAGTNCHANAWRAKMCPMPLKPSTENADPCPLCHRPLPTGSGADWHHLIPRSEGGTEQVRLHIICHQAIHAHLSEAELARDYATIAALRAHPGLVRFIAWVARRPPDYQDRSRWTRDRRRK